MSDLLDLAIAAHGGLDYHYRGGIAVPHRRPVYPLGADNRKVSEPVLVTIDIVRLGFVSP